MSKWVSRLFLVPKSRLGMGPVVDLQVLISHCRQFSMKFDTLCSRAMWTMCARKNDYMISVDAGWALRHRYHPEFRDFFTVNYRPLAADQWVDVPFMFHAVIKTVVDHLQTTLP